MTGLSSMSRETSSPKGCVLTKRTARTTRRRDGPAGPPYSRRARRRSVRTTRAAKSNVTGGPMRREARLARTFVELADTLVADFDVVELLTLVADRCVGVLDVDAA